MIRVLRLVLIFGLSLGAVIAPGDSSANMSEMVMTQMDTTESADQPCCGCDPTGFTDGLPCESGCPVPCGSNGTAGIIALAPSTRLAIPFGLVIPRSEPLILLGASPSLDPFPPKRPV